MLAGHGIDPARVPPRYHSHYFSHVFSGGYSAGYYAYIWSEVLARDAGEWFTANGGLRRANGDTCARRCCHAAAAAIRRPCSWTSTAGRPKSHRWSPTGAFEGCQTC